MDGKGRAIDNILLNYGGQSNTRMYIYKHILESAFTEDLKIILNFIRRLHQSLDYGTPYNITKEVA
jgi:hypothetical protein